MNILSVTIPDEICCPICETRHNMSEYITVYTKTLDGRILKSMICPAGLFYAPCRNREYAV